MSVLNADGIVKAYGGRRVVDQVTLDVRSGEVVGLLGPNGAGKTTLFHIVIGLVRADGGTVTLDGTAYGRAYLPARAGGYQLSAPGVFGIPGFDGQAESAGHSRNPGTRQG